MIAFTVADATAPEDLSLATLPDPTPDRDDVLIQIHASGVNRADVLQRRGLYPPPPGASDVLGLECAGVVLTAPVGSGFSVGDRVMALLPGGGYATMATVHRGSVMPMPDGWSFEIAAAFPEVYTTAHLNLCQIGGMTSGTRVLVHGGSGGVGTASIQIARALGAQIAVTAGGPDRCRRCCEAGADAAFDYRDPTWADQVGDWAEDGPDLVLDCVGGRYLATHQSLLAPDGRLVVIGLMGGRRAEIDLAALMSRRHRIIGSTLRSQTPADKETILRSMMGDLEPHIAQGLIRPVVDRVLPLAEAAAAHRDLDGGRVFGKLVLSSAEGGPQEPEAAC